MKKLLSLLLLTLFCPTLFAQTDWPNVGNDKGALRYSPLRQINRDNVKNLRVAWTYRTGDAGPENKTMIECTPIVVNGVMYITTAKVRVVALDAATGRELWKFDPFVSVPTTNIYPAGNGVNRGVAYWSAGSAERIYFASRQYLYSLDAKTGKLATGFGTGGRVDLRAGLGRDPESLTITATTPGVI